MNEKLVKLPGPDHPISIERNPSRVVVSVAGRVIADTRNALTLREAAYSPVQYIPGDDVDFSAQGFDLTLAAGSTQILSLSGTAALVPDSAHISPVKVERSSGTTDEAAPGALVDGGGRTRGTTRANRRGWVSPAGSV